MSPRLLVRPYTIRSYALEYGTDSLLSSSSAVVGTADELTGQAVYAFVAMKPEFDFQAHSEPELLKELTLQVRKVIGPFAAPKGIFLGASGSCVFAFSPCERILEHN